ncbi:hypothetical protein BD770DRAFT_334574 [Pilaira anomala]|nr:hypothetical protein BD770DRAFT_334574 [Pilaira anomala]
MIEQVEQKRSLKLKSIFRPQIDLYNNNSQTPSTLNRKVASHLQISPPVLQHSTSIYSLVSPTRTAFTSIYSSKENGKEIPYELYQPLSPPPPIPQQRTVTSTTGRRHSCSSTVIYKQQDTITVKQPKCELTQVSKTFRSKLRERRRSSKVGSTSSAAATIASIEEPCMEASKSTPSRKVKTYNVPKTISIEKQRKMQELEDLITGRRGSTVRLTLTPKGLS